jgi:hypothetical protein
MVRSFNGFSRIGIEWGSGEDGAGHRSENRRAGGAVDSASLGVEESAGGIGAAATPAEGGGGGCSEALGKTTVGWTFMGRMAEKPPRLVQGFGAEMETKMVLGQSWAA